MCRITKNKVLLFGGSLTEMQYFDDTWIFDLADTSWTKIETKNFPSARSHFGMSQITENKALLFGGRDSNIDMQKDTWLFDYDKMNWERLYFYKPPTPVPDYRIDPMLANITDKKVLLFGGLKEGYGLFYGDTWLFDLDSLRWFNLQTTGMTDSLWDSGMCK